MHKTFTPNLTGVYRPGVGMTVTRANVAAFQKQMAEQNREAPNAHAIVMAFACHAEQVAGSFPNGPTYSRRLKRAHLALAALRERGGVQPSPQSQTPKAKPPAPRRKPAQIQKLKPKK